MQTSKNIYPIEKILSAATYLTAGGVGFVWLIIATLTRKTVTPFLLYHIMQSIFISILFFLLSVFGELIYFILYRIPIINSIPYLLNFPIPFAFNLSIIQLFTTTIILYLAVTSFCGKLSYLPWVSDIIKGSANRR